MRARRKEAHLSQVALGESAGVSLGSLKRFERTGEISLASLAKIADALGCESGFDGLFAPPPEKEVRDALRTLEAYIDRHAV